MAEAAGASATVEVSADDLRAVLDAVRLLAAEQAATREALRRLALALAPLPQVKPSNRELLVAAVERLGALAGSVDGLRADLAASRAHPAAGR